MNDNIVPLRIFIDNDISDSDFFKLKTFCELMRNVSKKITEDKRNIIKINIDNICINRKTGEIILPDNLFGNSDNMEKTMIGLNTGISLMADRKSTIENERVSFALMMLGWYCNPNKNSISSDMEVLENFDYYMSKIPSWLQNFFINVFRKMDYSVSFDQYYDSNFTEKVRQEIQNSFIKYNLTEEQLNRISDVVIKRASRIGENNEG